MDEVELPLRTWAIADPVLQAERKLSGLCQWCGRKAKLYLDACSETKNGTGIDVIAKGCMQCGRVVNIQEGTE